MSEELQVRVHGPAGLPTLIYFPGLHGDWTLISSFRASVAGRARFVEITYPRTVDWSLADYAAAVEAGLLKHGIEHGWVLAESFGSQVAWALLGRIAGGPNEAPLGVPGGANADASAGRFRADGLVLAGGFVRYPVMWLLRLGRAVCGGISLRWITGILVTYAKYARFRHRHAPETLANISEFIARRTETDRRAMEHRLRLITSYDPRPTARQTTLPVYWLTGALDPIVPWPSIRPWLKRHCPGYRDGRVIWRADHNVLSTEPRAAAAVILDWMATP